MARGTTDPALATELNNQAKLIEEQWGENGTLRLAAHTVVGGLSGSWEGAAGAAAGTLTGPEVRQMLLAAGVDPTLTAALTALASTAAGGMVGGTTGAGTAFNEVTNNYLKHSEISDLLAKEKACRGGGGAAACQQWEARKAELKAVSEKSDKELKESCADSGSSTCQAKQQELRSAFAEILRESATGTSESYWASSEVFETWRMATGSLPTTDLVWATGKTMVTDFITGIKDMTPFELQKSGMKELWTIIDNDGHLDNTTTGAVIDLASNPALAMAMLQGATREQVLSLADAYERGDSDAIGKLQGQMLGIVLSVGGGGAGTAGKFKKVIGKAAGLKKVEKAAEAAQAAKVASVTKGVKDNSSLLDQKAITHILDGDGPTSGGHRFGTGIPGKSEFPQSWSDQKIINVISDIATDPKVQWSKPDARGYVTASAIRDGVDVKVVYDVKNSRIVTGYPTNTPKNPKP